MSWCCLGCVLLSYHCLPCLKEVKKSPCFCTAAPDLSPLDLKFHTLIFNLWPNDSCSSDLYSYRLHPGTTESDTPLQAKGKHVTPSGTSLHLESSYTGKANPQFVNWPLHILSGPALALSDRLPGAVCHRCHPTMQSLTGSS